MAHKAFASQNINLGTFDSEEAAARAYDKAIMEMTDRTTPVNFPDNPPAAQPSEDAPVPAEVFTGDSTVPRIGHNASQAGAFSRPDNHVDEPFFGKQLSIDLVMLSHDPVASWYHRSITSHIYH